MRPQTYVLQAATTFLLRTTLLFSWPRNRDLIFEKNATSETLLVILVYRGLIFSEILLYTGITRFFYHLLIGIRDRKNAGVFFTNASIYRYRKHLLAFTPLKLCYLGYLLRALMCFDGTLATNHSKVKGCFVSVCRGITWKPRCSQASKICTRRF